MLSNSNFLKDVFVELVHHQVKTHEVRNLPKCFLISGCFHQQRHFRPAYSVNQSDINSASALSVFLFFSLVDLHVAHKTRQIKWLHYYHTHPDFLSRGKYFYSFVVSAPSHHELVRLRKDSGEVGRNLTCPINLIILRERVVLLVMIENHCCLNRIIERRCFLSGRPSGLGL